MRRLLPEPGQRRLRRIAAAIVVVILGSATNVGAQSQPAPSATTLDTAAKLGAALFADRNLSVSRKQNCVSCHSPELAFTDPRALGEVQGAVSRGADGRSLGDRNAPTLGYAALTPNFAIGDDALPRGGLFHDGRAHTLEDQVRDPLTNPVELAMPDKPSVVARLKENASYVQAFSALYRLADLDDVDRTYDALADALATFLRQDDMSPFDAKLDRALAGGATLSDLERAGQALFYSATARCSQCHAGNSVAPAAREVFTSYRYVNLGVPPNTTVRRLNATNPDFIDLGLTANAATPTAENVKSAGHHRTAGHDGQFKVPSLRNVAITGPYMHNGIFQELQTAILFHLRFVPGQGGAAINPETGTAWDTPEVPRNLATADLPQHALSDADIDALIAFLQTLTDRRYERLLPN